MRPYADKTFLPLLLLLLRTFLPFFVDILFLKPCSFFLCLVLGWYVCFMDKPPSSKFIFCNSKFQIAHIRLIIILSDLVHVNLF